MSTVLASLDNEVIFKKAFTDKLVFETFVLDVLGIKIEVDKIETEKQFSPKIGNIDFKLDIFAESTDKRVVVELQRIEYDHNFDRFLHYFLALIIEQQKSAKNYGIEQTVYAIIIMTEPYTIKDRSDRPIRNEVLMMSINPRTLLGQEIQLYGHQFIVLNPNHPEENTPIGIRDWLTLIYQSIHNPENAVVNIKNKGIERAIRLISYDNLNPNEVESMKNKEAARVASFVRARFAAEEMIIKLNENNVSLQTIAKSAGMTEMEVEKIIQKKSA